MIKVSKTTEVNVQALALNTTRTVGKRMCDKGRSLESSYK